MSKGDHICVSRGFYSHHGIDCGNGKVIHYTGTPENKSNAAVKRTSLTAFANGASVKRVSYKQPIAGVVNNLLGMFNSIRGGGFSPLGALSSTQRTLQSLEVYTGSEAVRRAESRLGEKNYNLAFSNCEHFAVWCKTGFSRSKQVEEVKKYFWSISPL